MTSSQLVIKEIKKKTKAKVFEHFEVGDVLRFSTRLRNTSGASRGNYASDVTVRNLTRGTSVTKSQSELLIILERVFVLEENNG